MYMKVIVYLFLVIIEILYIYEVCVYVFRLFEFGQICNGYFVIIVQLNFFVFIGYMIVFIVFYGGFVDVKDFCGIDEYKVFLCVIF